MCGELWANRESDFDKAAPISSHFKSAYLFNIAVHIDTQCRKIFAPLMTRTMDKKLA